MPAVFTHSSSPRMGGDERKATLNPEAEPVLGNAQDPRAKTPNRTNTPLISTPSARMQVGIFHR